MMRSRLHVLLVGIAVVAAAAAALPAGLPIPPRQTAVQRAVIAKIAAQAAADSPRSTSGVLSFLDDASFRANLCACCSSVAALPASALYARFKAELGVMELVHK